MNATQKDYYGSDEMESISYLEFGSIDFKARNKNIWAYRQDQEAYDMYMFSRYASDLFLFRDFITPPSLSQNNITVDGLNACILKSAHNKIADYLFKYAGLITAVHFNAQYDICESGSSLFGWIDEAIACDYVFNRGVNISGIKSLSYLGSEISDFMNKGAEALHAGYTMRFSLAPTVTALMNEINKLSLFYGLGVSMRYALRKAEDLQVVAQKTELAIFNRLSVTKEHETKTLIYGSGKKAYVISLPVLIRILRNNGVSAKYCTANRQQEKDGNNTLRASIVLSKDSNIINKFIANYNDCILKSDTISGVVEGEWKDICQLMEE